MKSDTNRANGSGTAVDLINGPIMKNLLIFMLPILISYVFQQLYNAVDTAIVGHFLGEQSSNCIMRWTPRLWGTFWESSHWLLSGRMSRFLT